MKIIKHDSRQLIVETKIGFNFFLLIWGVFFGGIPLFILTAFFAGLGVINIDCEKVEINNINCQVERTKFAGLKIENLQSFNNLIKVQFEQIKGVDSDGQRTINNTIILENKYGEQLLIEDAMFINGVKGKEKKMRLITSKLQNFLNSQDIYLIVNYDNRWRWANLVIFLFLSVFIFIGCTVLIMDIISIGYEKFIFDKSTSKFSFEKVNLLEKKHENYRLQHINSIIIEVDKDSDGDKVYSLIVSINNKTEYKLDRAVPLCDRNSQLAMIQANADEIANFLNVQVVTKVK
ncbi:hypothetical protein [Geminocystis herdmanii]|uniref:hypothetical protein n=1 Tax=Geminocystis herdmanii TaxID=669359 RepID=UPI0003698E50|nr:hypothetical protein [Geminocystis herdmanii]